MAPRLPVVTPDRAWARASRVQRRIVVAQVGSTIQTCLIAELPPPMVGKHWLLWQASFSLLHSGAPHNGAPNGIFLAVGGQDQGSNTFDLAPTFARFFWTQTIEQNADTTSGVGFNPESHLLRLPTTFSTGNEFSGFSCVSYAFASAQPLPIAAGVKLRGIAINNPGFPNSANPSLLGVLSALVTEEDDWIGGPAS